MAADNPGTGRGIHSKTATRVNRIISQTALMTPPTIFTGEFLSSLTTLFGTVRSEIERGALFQSAK
jgi:hypothetical protein